MRNDYNDSSPTNFFVVQQVNQELSRHGVELPGRLLDNWLAIRKNLKVQLVHDPILLTLLKKLEVVKPRASHVKLASCAALYTALKRHPALRHLVQPIQALRQEEPPLGAVSSVVPPEQLQPPRQSGTLRQLNLYGGGVHDNNHNASSPPPFMATLTAAALGDNAIATGGSRPTVNTDTPSATTRADRAANTINAAAHGGRGAAGYRPLQDKDMFYTSRHRFPTRLPRRADWNRADGGSKKSRFGLLFQFRSRKKVPRECPFRTELKRYEQWCLEPLNLAAGGKPGVQPKTLRSYANVLSKYLGFAYKTMGVPLPFVSIRLITNQVKPITLN